MKYAHIDENNLLLGFYDDQINKTIPTPNVQLTVEQWRLLLNNQHNKVNADGTGETVDTRTAEEIANEYKFQRLAEYPPIGDQLDALFHAGVFPADMAATIQAVKDKYPKGDA